MICSSEHVLKNKFSLLPLYKVNYIMPQCKINRNRVFFVCFFFQRWLCHLFSYYSLFLIFNNFFLVLKLPATFFSIFNHLIFYVIACFFFVCLSCFLLKRIAPVGLIKWSKSKVKLILTYIERNDLHLYWWKDRNTWAHPDHSQPH